MEENVTIERVGKESYAEIVDVWEASVRATHDFLSEEDIQFFKPLILNEYLAVVDLCCIRDPSSGRIMGFLGTVGQQIEMLFIHPDYRNKGMGKAFMEYAIRQCKANRVEVNEQNEQAVGFYKHLGFKVIKRCEYDNMGKPFPLLQMML
ncbi:putative acetyltransferase [Rhabdobacter roseus]|uniref:Putative acetyltransferase n=1 Tax=Rhabdobacter roseus TaxID=1655419 RepID=A0A840U531_9BACT|nr:GNAT family N-acetyltransferase [Rhabdobacter roseus]MBB5286919.1 putative acetyltransferase [Rhabdobacter roseus]